MKESNRLPDSEKMCLKLSILINAIFMAHRDIPMISTGFLV